jgi:hypothetical protein
LLCVSACRPSPPVVVAVPAALSPGQARRVCARVEAQLARGGGDHVVCVLADAVDLGLVDLLARLTLIARRAGAVVRVLPHRHDLQVLLQLTGLDRELRER